MQKVVTYKCDICGKEGQKQDVIAACEKSHYTPDSVSKPIYDQTDRKGEYPESVLVHFTNGKTARYKRTKD